MTKHIVTIFLNSWILFSWREQWWKWRGWQDFIKYQQLKEEKIKHIKTYIIYFEGFYKMVRPSPVPSQPSIYLLCHHHHKPRCGDKYFSPELHVHVGVLKSSMQFRALILESHKFLDYVLWVEPPSTRHFNKYHYVHIPCPNIVTTPIKQYFVCDSVGCGCQPRAMWE